MDIVRILALLFLTTASTCSGARILGIVLMPSKSHDILVSRLLKELAERGHKVTYITPFSDHETTANFTLLHIQDLKKSVEGNYREHGSKHKPR